MAFLVRANALSKHRDAIAEALELTCGNEVHWQGVPINSGTVSSIEFIGLPYVDTDGDAHTTSWHKRHENEQKAVIDRMIDSLKISIPVEFHKEILCMSACHYSFTPLSEILPAGSYIRNAA